MQTAYVIAPEVLREEAAQLACAASGGVDPEIIEGLIMAPGNAPMVAFGSFFHSAPHDAITNAAVPVGIVIDPAVIDVAKAAYAEGRIFICDHLTEECLAQHSVTRIMPAVETVASIGEEAPNVIIAAAQVIAEDEPGDQNTPTPFIEDEPGV